MRPIVPLLEIRSLKDLKEGDNVVAIIKATEVSVEKE